MYVDFNVNDSTTPGDYSWTLVKGADGTQGTPGKPGADGKTPYFHTAWSHSADGTDGFTTVYPNLNLLDGTKDIKPWATGNNIYNQDVEVIYFNDHKTVADLFKVGDIITLSYDIEFFNTELYNSSNDSAIRIQMLGGGWRQFSQVYAKNVNGKFYTKNEQISSEYVENPTHKVNISITMELDKYFIESHGNSNAIRLVYDYIPKGADTKLTNLKIEPAKDLSSTATPYMPSASEVTTADWPSYIGQYTDFTQADSTNPSDYTWSLIRGNDGKDGADGKDGIAGKDGVGIKTTVITYAISTSGTTAPNTGWTSQVPTLVKGQYLWTKTVWTYSDTTSETGYTVSYIAKDGNNGNDGIAGKDGVGINSTTITYASHTNGTTAPTTGYTTTVPSVPAGQFLWTKTVWTYTDNTSETGYSVAKMGNNGETGPQGPQGNTGPQGPTGPAGSNGNPGKVVSDTEPTTKFKGLTWKYSGVVDMTLGDGTKILAGTEYYWNGMVWALYEINAHNINGDNLSVTNGTFKDGKIESIWGGNGVNGTTTIEDSHLQIHSSDSTTNTENTVAIDNRQGYAQVYTERNTGRVITVQASFQGFFVSDSTGPFVRVTPNGIKTSSDKSYNSFQIGAGITMNLERRGDIVEATLSGSINYPLTSNTKFSVGLI
ncbi:hypothetical protein, partial [Lactococcus cremoris]